MKDLISRQAAIDKKVLLEDWTGKEYEAILVEDIKHLPSAQPDLDEWCTDCKEYDSKRHYCPRFNRVIREALKDAKKGEWLRMSDLSEKDDNRYKCSRCGNVIYHKSRMDLYTFNSWCGRCGSDNSRHTTIIEVDKSADAHG